MKRVRDENLTAAETVSPFLTLVLTRFAPYIGALPSFCGGGLRCYRHECLPCLNGMVDYTDGAPTVTPHSFSLPSLQIRLTTLFNE